MKGFSSNFCLLFFWISLLLWSNNLIAQGQEYSDLRIVTLAPHLAEIVYALGGEEHVVGVISGSDYPENTPKKAIVGSASGVDFERLVILQPTIILAWKNGNKQADLLKLKRLGVKVLTLPSESIADLYHQIYIIGDILQEDIAADRLVRSLKNRVANLSHFSRIETRKNVFIQIWSNPIFTIGKDHFINEALHICGAANVAESYPFISSSVSTEFLVFSRADVILNLTGTSAMPNGYHEMMGSFQSQVTPHIIDFDPAYLMRLGPRFVDGVEGLCSAINEM